ncbi:MAG: type II secretion system protein GspG [Planctomycetota bacterium]|nr:type II secretion system protein GspG [Planctomycetota bacterium]
MVRRSAERAAKAQIQAIQAALDNYASDHRSYPQSEPSVDLVPPDGDPASFQPLFGLALSSFSSQYGSGDLAYYQASIEEVDLNADGTLDDDDRYNGDFHTGSVGLSVVLFHGGQDDIRGWFQLYRLLRRA